MSSSGIFETPRRPLAFGRVIAQGLPGQTEGPHSRFRYSKDYMSKSKLEVSAKTLTWFHGPYHLSLTRPGTIIRNDFRQNFGPEVREPGENQLRGLLSHAADPGYLSCPQKLPERGDVGTPIKFGSTWPDLKTENYDGVGYADPNVSTKEAG